MTTQDKVLGVMQLDTKFERIPGDIGNVESYDFPAKVKIVSGASVQRVVIECDYDKLRLFGTVSKRNCPGSECAGFSFIPAANPFGLRYDPRPYRNYDG
jgi:hypothetical protein